MRDQSSFDLYKLLFIAGNVTVEGNINSNSELSGTVSVRFTAPGLFVVASVFMLLVLLCTSARCYGQMCRLTVHECSVFL